MPEKCIRLLGAILLMIMVAGCDLPEPIPTVTPTVTPLPWIYLNTAEPTNSPVIQMPLPLIRVSPIQSLFMFWEDFDDDDLNVPAPPWSAGTHAQGYHNVDCSLGCWLRFNGPDYGGVHDTGLMHLLGEAYEGIQPTYISFDIFSWSLQDAHVGYFLLEGKVDYDQPGSYRAGIQFHIIGHQFSINWNTYDIEADWMTQWSQVEFKNFDWDATPPKFDLYLDGELVGGCISFINTVSSFQYLHLYNLDTGYVGYDNIFMGIGYGDNAAQEPHCSAPPPPLPPPPQATATLTAVPVVCANLDAQQCNQRSQECKWMPVVTHPGGGYCTDK
ncbi:MAG: hypothetical protein FJZ96_01390 [Chloroflexi bacterium]|nr:hypothetical protein [Chloroflexota bacterium]